ncbi:hypothetical protein GYMLUDRAFT_941080 [Collybiopsis luxurians FD-317 M1]|uniref:Unplaced genomic scaffold GYMLUscaffold_83, whole genome shotgun sequence n=1 Tax=Collybiopsis luxurians FD-317 M1 TaxID=944289 RepID=A0A0D0BUM4_9AGAR|nr:hypothetical protein GYMLUDRAFT_941080 [Collybiopsis luxurians FD-317 M1]
MMKSAAFSVFDFFSLARLTRASYFSNEFTLVYALFNDFQSPRFQSRETIFVVVVVPTFVFSLRILNLYFVESIRLSAEMIINNAICPTLMKHQWSNGYDPVFP